MSTMANSIGAVHGARRDAGRTQGLLHLLTRTEAGTLGLLSRLALALVIFPHGAQKLLGWYGGYGFEGTMGFLTGTMGLPAVVALLVIGIEFFGPIALAVGFLGRVAAAGIGAVMIGAVVTTHLPFGFFMDWAGTQAGQGFEFHLLALALAGVVLLGGSGAYSVDRRIADAGGDGRPRRGMAATSRA